MRHHHPLETGAQLTELLAFATAHPGWVTLWLLMICYALTEALRRKE